MSNATIKRIQYFGRIVGFDNEAASAFAHGLVHHIKGMTASMSRKGDCWDNAPMESFWGTLKNELVHHRHYRTRVQAIQEITEYIEIFYNLQRKQAMEYAFFSPSWTRKRTRFRA